VGFGSGGALEIDFGVADVPARGALAAVGTEDRPIVFTSASDLPLAGDWLGIYFAGTPDDRDRLDFVRVEYAGGTRRRGSASCSDGSGSPNDAAIRFQYGVPRPGLVTHTTVVSSAAHGIDRGWVGDPIDLLPTNDFQGVARCSQSYPRPSAGGCPSPAP